MKLSELPPEERARLEAKARSIKARLPEYLRSMGIDPSKQFRCLNPEHEDRHPSMGIAIEKDGLPRAHCFACNANYSTFDLIGIQYNLTEECAIFHKAYELFNMEDDGTAAGLPTAQAPTFEKLSTDRKEAAKDLTELVEEAHKALLEKLPTLDYPLDYLTGRGLSMEIIKEYKIGFCAGGYNKFFESIPEYQTKSRKAPLYRLFFPYFDEVGGVSYVLSEIADRKQIDQYNDKYRMIRGVSARLFNERYIKTGAPVIFVCEGVYDALSVETVGGKALALIGIGHRRFIRLCKEHRPETVFVLSLDADLPGQSGVKRIKDGLDELKIPYIEAVPPYGKDFNDCLIHKKPEFSLFIAETIEKATKLYFSQKENELQEEEEEAEAARADTVSFYIDTLMAEDIAKYSRKRRTGFPILDFRSGGLFPGLYLLAAVSSLGKTSFALQIADQLAEQGEDVLFFSLEMGRLELVTKSIARTIAQEKPDGQKITALSIRGGYLPKIVLDAAERYKESIGDRLSIIEGRFDMDVSFISDYVKKYIQRTGALPVVFIDYVQIIPPSMEDVKRGRREALDSTITELARLSKEYNIPVICISSVNRGSYQNPVSFEALKESGTLEYSADVIWGLQLSCLNDPLFEAEKKTVEKRKRIEQEKKANPRKIELCTLKNRFGVSSFSCDFLYYPDVDLFEEAGGFPRGRMEEAKVI